MAAPRIDISVDPATGAWTTDGMPMLYVPRHFLMGLLRGMREALGEEAAQRQFYQSSHDAAYRWCEMESRATGMAGIAVFHHYMRRLSERGWGLFDSRDIDAATGTGTVRLRHSSFVADAGQNGTKTCGFCAGWAPGALAWVAASQNLNWRLTGREARCAAEGHPACDFIVEPA